MHLAILWTLDALGQRAYGGANDKKLYFGLTGSMALAKDSAAEKTTVIDIRDQRGWLSPWRWSNLSFRVAYYDGVWQQLPMAAGADPGVRIIQPSAARPTEFSDALTKQFAAIAKAADTRDRGSMDDSQGGPESLETVLDRTYFWQTDQKRASAGGRPWHVQLAQIATSPHPLGWWANLSFIVTVDPETPISLGDGTKSTIAAALTAPGTSPWLAASVAFTSTKLIETAPADVSHTASYSPATAPDPSIDGAALESGANVQWPMVPSSSTEATPPTAKAYVGCTRLLPPGNSAGLVNLASGWLRSAPVMENDAWRAKLAPGAGELFDVSQRLIDALRVVVAGSGSSVPADIVNNWFALSDLVVAAMHDQTNGGMMLGPDGSSVLRVLWDRFIATRDPASPIADAAAEAVWTAVDSAWPTTAPTTVGPLTLAIWRSQLRNVLKAPLNDAAALQPAVVDSRIIPLAERVEELQRIRDALRNPDTLFDVIAAQWPSLPVAVAGSGAWAEFQQWARDNVAKKTPLWRDLAVTTLGDVHEQSTWRAVATIASNVLAAPAERANAPDRLLDALENVIYLRAGLATAHPVSAAAPSPDAAYLRRFAPAAASVPRSALDVLIPAVRRLSTDRASELIPPIDAEETRTSTAHPLVVQVAEGALYSESDGADATDVMRRLRGIGLLIRRSKGVGPARETGWMSPHMARLADTNLSSAGTVALPTRLSYVQGVRRVTISYDDDPIGAPTPAAALSADHVFYGAPANSPKVVDAVFDYAPVAPTAAWGRIPALVFGAEYEVLPFAVTNEGALPRGLAGAHPAEWNAKWDPSAPADLGVPNSALIARKVYTRRVPVSGPRLEPVTGKPFLPPIGRKTAERDPVVPLRWHGLTAADESAGRTAPAVLVLAAENGAAVPTTHSFVLRPPATDLTTWDRWMAGVEPPSTHAPWNALRESVWAEFHRRAVDNHTRAPNVTVADGTDDVTIDDPAIRSLRAVLTRISASGDTTVNQTTIDIAHPLAGDWRASEQDGANDVTRVRFARVQRRYTLKVDATANAESLTATSDGFAIQVRTGSLYRLTITGVVGADANRFAKSAKPAANEGAAFVIGIEVATKAMPTSGALLRMMTPSARQNRTFEATVDLNEAADDTAAYVGAIDTVWQDWVWDGRPLTHTPGVTAGVALPTGAWTAAALPNDGAAPPMPIDEWELRAFGAVQDNFPRKEPAREIAPPAGTPAARRFRGEYAPVDNGGARYVRVAVRASSRYADLYPAAAGPKVIDTRVERWVGMLMPADPDATPAVPRVVAVFPLTERAVDDDDVTMTPNAISRDRQPGLLVICRERWFEHGGLAETLVANIVDAVDLSKPASTPQGPNGMKEFGTDPTLSKALAKPAGACSVLGPIGHAADPSESRPVFATTSWIVEPPPLDSTNGAETRYPWLFAKLEFTRRLRQAQTVRRVRPGVSLDSRPTRGEWVQFLPPFSLLEPSSGAASISVGSLVVKPGAIVAHGPPDTLELRARLGAAAFDPKSGGTSFRLYLFVTRVVQDVYGNPNQEAFVGIYARRGGAGTTWTILKPGDSSSTRAVSSDSELRVRVFEVQRGVGDAPNIPGKTAANRPPDIGWPKETSEDEFLGSLFPIATKQFDVNAPGRLDPPNDAQIADERARCRIVRVSRYITSLASPIPVPPGDTFDMDSAQDDSSNRLVSSHVS